MSGNEYTGDLSKLDKIAEIQKIDGNWVTGTINEWRFEAKIFATSSDYGIDSGRISKLDMRQIGTNRIEVNYDRSWDIKPNKGTTAYRCLEKLLKALKGS